MADDYYVDVWLGFFRDKDTFWKLFAEQYDDDDAPLSTFAEETLDGQFYDHDQLEAEFRGAPTANVGELLAGHSYSASYVEAVRALLATRPVVFPGFLAERLGFSFEGAFNVSVLLFDAGLNAQATMGEGYLLHYVGQVAYDPDAGEVEVT